MPSNLCKILHIHMWKLLLKLIYCGLDLKKIWLNLDCKCKTVNEIGPWTIWKLCIIEFIKDRRIIMTIKWHESSFPILHWGDAYWGMHHPLPRAHINITDMTFYSKILWSLKTMRLLFQIIISLWNTTGTSAAILLSCLSNFRMTGQILHNPEIPC